jgi:hypothetical protein
VVSLEVVGVHPKEESIEDRGQGLIAGDLVRRSEDADERATYDLTAARILTLVQQGEQRVQDRAVRLEHLVEEDDLCLRQHTRRVAPIDALTKRRNVDGSEDLVRLRETGQEILEVLGLQ